MAALLGAWRFPDGQLSLVRAILAGAPELLNPASDPTLHSTMVLEDRDVRSLPRRGRRSRSTSLCRSPSNAALLLPPSHRPSPALLPPLLPPFLRPPLPYVLPSPWICRELLQALLAMDRTRAADGARALLEAATKSFPEILAMGLAQIHVCAFQSHPDLCLCTVG